MNSRWSAAALVGIGMLGIGSLQAQDVERGRQLYDRWCAGCHGDTGAGDGESAAYMLPRPRDFTQAIYQIRTTASGELPTDADLRKVIDDGMPGSTMPAWRDRLGPGERDDIIAYLKTFSRFFDGADPQPIATGRRPGRPSEDDLAEGRRLFVDELQCLRCHGDAGRGDGPSAAELTDDSGFLIRAADLSKNWMFNGGGTVDDIYMRMRTGLDGTPMPSNSDVIDAGIITDEQLWRVAQYVRSLAPEDAPVRRDVIRAALRPGALPGGLADPAWNEIDSYYIPLVGQITVKPRWFVPEVTEVWVQAAHDNQSLVLKLTWNDRSRSPDPGWDPFFDGVKQSLISPDTAHLTEQGPDRIAVQFPLELPEGTELPFFLGGEPRSPVYIVQWTSTPDQVVEGTAAGLGTFAPTGSDGVSHEAGFADGQWQLLLRRSLVPADTTQALALVTGQTIPIAFYAADGTSGEDDVRGAISAWYAIHLDVPTPTTVFVAPLVALVVTAGLGVTVVKRAQKRGRATS